MSPLQDHALRYPLANELHARPFPSMSGSGTVAYLALKCPQNAASRNRDQDFQDLTALLDKFGTPHPQQGVNHFFGPLGRFMFKWEQHTEFVTYTVFSPVLSDVPFDASNFSVFPESWLSSLQSVRVTSAIIRVEGYKTDRDVEGKLGQWFVPESVAASAVLGNAAIAAGDFRIDEAGHQRFALFVNKGTGERRIGRIIQRLCEIETYKAMSMLGFSRAREASIRMGQIDSELSQLMAAMTDHAAPADKTLDKLLQVSAELEQLSAQSAYRFSATKAYQAIVAQRIEVLREDRFEGRQTFQEFMMRRYEPAMRTVVSTEDRLSAMANRAMRAGDLLRTRVDVERSAQNQSLLESMDRRADLQLRLQETVEGLSVVAISYYAVSLASYLFYPLADTIGVSKGIITAVLTLPVVVLVWMMVRSIRRRMD